MRTATPKHARIGDLLAVASARRFVGRRAELEALVRCTEEGAPLVSFVHGISGVGKTALLAAASAELEARGVTVVRLDARNIEPTTKSMLEAVARGVGVHAETPAMLGDALAGRSVVFAYDNFESLTIMEGWLRLELLVAMPSTVRLFVFSRCEPQCAWLTSPGWAGVTRVYRLGALGLAEARAFLEDRGVASASLDRIIALSHGHPLTLELAASAFADGRPVRSLPEGDVLETLARRCLEDVPDPALRSVVEAASVVRAVTRPLLASMLEAPSDDTRIDALVTLPFVERCGDEIVLAESVRKALEQRICAVDPHRYQALRRAAWRNVRVRLERSMREKVTWRDAADALFLVRHPSIREAVFPSTDRAIDVEPALSSDEACVMAIMERHDPEETWPILRAWWTHAREAFQIARDRKGNIVGFGVLMNSDLVPKALYAVDPLITRWRADLAARVEGRQPAMYARRVLSADGGEALTDVSGALWIDAKREYFKHPNLGSVYVATRNPIIMIPSLERCGFQIIGLRERTEETMRLDFGRDGVFGWISRLIDTDEGDESQTVIRVESGELVIDEARMPLSPLEHGALTYLAKHRGRVVSRDALLENVWKQHYGGSNVVDAVIRLLRKKLGEQASLLKTVKGFGYRLEEEERVSVVLVG